MPMAPTAAASEDMTTTGEDDAGRMEMTTRPVTHILHQAYACWDSEETRHFYEDILELPLIATVVTEDPFRTDGSGYCYTFFEIGDGNTLAFFEHMSLVHPKYFNARSPCHRHVAFEVQSEEHTSELQSLTNLVCRLLLEKKKNSPQLELRRAHSSVLIL